MISHFPFLSILLGHRKKNFNLSVFKPLQRILKSDATERAHVYKSNYYRCMF